jgi:phospholipid-translocating ATPase
MLTGDKLETAKCIGVCTGFKSEYQSFYEISTTDEDSILSKLAEFDNQNHCLVVTGAAIEVIFRDGFLIESFLDKTRKAKSVILCRCAPKQKAQVAKAIKDKFEKVVCCIGDGGNDVGMIQESNVGIGIEGKEGLQASLASDVSVRRFMDIEMLFLWHGRLSYLRTSKLSNFVMHRGLIITVIQVIFIVIFYYVSINIYNGYLIMGYSTIFTNLPVFALILDQDIPMRQALNYPILYNHVQKGKNMNLTVFLIWLWKSIFQGSLIIILSILLLSKTFTEIVTITFTALIFIEFLNIASMIRTWHKYIFLSIVISLILYFFCLIFLRRLFLLSVLEIDEFFKICLLSLITWLPFQIYQSIQRRFFPEKIDIVINEAKIEEKRLQKKKKSKSDLNI